MEQQDLEFQCQYPADSLRHYKMTMDELKWPAKTDRVAGNALAISTEDLGQNMYYPFRSGLHTPNIDWFVNHVDPCKQISN